MFQIGSVNSFNSTNFYRVQKAQQTAMRNLSTGYRINRASDDAAGLAIVSQLFSQISGLNQAQRNSNDVISLTQVADSSLGQINNNLSRMRELAMQAANGTYNDEQRGAIEQEYTALKSEVDSITSSTEFNDQKLINGDFSSGKDFQIGTGSGTDSRLNLKIEDSSSAALNLDTTTVASQAGASSALSDIDGAMNKISSQRADLGATMNRIERHVSNISNQKINLTSARSQIQDADIAQETSNLANNNVLKMMTIMMEKKRQDNSGLLLALLN